MKYILDKKVILRDDSDFLDRYSLYHLDKSVKMSLNKEGFLIFSALNSPLTKEQLAKFILNTDRTLDEKQSLEAAEDIIKSGIEMGIIVETMEDHSDNYAIEALKSYEYKIKPMRFPLEALISITKKCNLRCRHCMAADLEKIAEDDMSTDTIKRLLDEFDKYGLQYLKFTGRETTLRKDYLDILEYASTKRFGIIVLTNGTAFSDSDIKRLGQIKQRRKNAFYIAISLDGACAASHEALRGVPGCFDKTITNIKKLANVGAMPFINTALHNYNKDEIEEIIKLCIDLKIEYMTISYMMNLGDACQNSDVFLNTEDAVKAADNIKALKAKYGQALKIFVDAKHIKTDAADVNETEGGAWPDNCCPAGISTVVINSNGDVYPCIECMGITDFVIDNIKGKSILEMWHHPKWQIYRGGWEVCELEACANCEDVKNCKLVRCRLYPAMLEGNFYGAVQNCKVII